MNPINQSLNPVTTPTPDPDSIQYDIQLLKGLSSASEMKQKILDDRMSRGDYYIKWVTVDGERIKIVMKKP